MRIGRPRPSTVTPAMPDDPISGPELGTLCRSLRDRKRLSLRDLAGRSGISAPMLSQVERGETSPTLSLAARLAAGFDISLPQLLEAAEGRDTDLSAPVESISAQGLGPYIRALRESRGLSRSNLCSKAGVSQNSLAQLERDEMSPTISFVGNLAVVLGLSLPQLLRSEVVLPTLDLQVKNVSDALIALLCENPNLMRDLRPRQFEELLAALYEREGFDVELTQETRDGGVDLYLVRHESFGRVLTLVDAKRYRADRPVGVGAVRKLFGSVETKNASMGIIATTSFFSRPAQRLQEEIPFRLGLQDFRDVHRMLRQAGKDNPAS